MKQPKLVLFASILIFASSFVCPLTLERTNNDILKADGDTSTASTNANTAAPTPTPAPPKPNTEVCYDHVGCFNNRPPFDNAANYLPIPPEVLNTGIWLYTSGDQEEHEFLSYTDENVIRNSKYNKNYPLKIIIHGFQNGGNETWITAIKNNIFLKEKNKANVIVLDWVIGAVFPLYFNATANTRLVGRQTCLAIKLIRKVFYNDVWSKDFHIHCIGHSLGAHTCGYASKYCDRFFDRISAMDPAGPNFEGTTAEVRIDKTDAKFVDVMHTNGDNLLTGNFGMSSPVGHVDFYPNGGKQQPGCPGILDLIGSLFTNASGAASSVSCSHGRAYNIFAESIISPCTYLGYPCQSQTKFEEGGCFDCGTEGCAQMGYYTSIKSRGVKYLLTNSRAPFCAYPYLIEISINADANKTAGELTAVVYAGEQNVTAMFTKKTEDIAINQTYKRVFATERDILDIDKLFVRFDKKNKPFFGADPNAPEVVIDKVRLLVGETDEVYSECVPNMPIRDKEMVEIRLDLEDCRLRAKESNRRKFIEKFNNKK